MKKVLLLFILMFLTGTVLEAQTVDVTFKVDMSIMIAQENFNPAGDTVFIRGSFNDWGKTAMSDADADSVYAVTLMGQPQNADLAYKYYFNEGDSWESDPNREVNTGTDATLELDPYFFDGRTPYTGTAADVIFSVDMRVPAQTTFNPSTHHVFIAGNFTTWQTNAIEMTDADGDTIYSVGLNGLFNSGDLAIYKFIYSASDAGSGTWESPTEGDDIFDDGQGNMNRIAGIVDGANVISRFWNNEEPTGPIVTADGNIFFEVDMSVATELGVFDPNVDSVQIRGSFNGWNASDPPRSLMNQNPADPNNWFLDIPFVNYELNSIQHYKYFINNPGDPEEYANTGWEVSIDPTDAGNRDRPIVFEGIDDQEAGLNYFEGIRPDWVIPAGTTVECTFSVNMTYATLADTQGTNPVFIPGTDSVFWIPQHPFYYAVYGLTWGVTPRVLELTDPDQDMIYTGTLTINGPSFNGFLYTYGYSSTSGIIQEAPGSQMDMRVRFIGQTGPRMFESPYTMPLDIWSNSAMPEEEGPVTSIRELPNAPLVYSLGQNYPNPFNPATKIRFSVAEPGLVTLKVYNLLGQEVATLLNNEMKSGSYEVDFNAASYSSGVYFYTITANNYKATKKMILMK